MNIELAVQFFTLNKNINNKTQGVDVLKFNHLATYLGVAVFIAACGETVTSQEHIAKAKSAIEKNEFSVSEIELKNALKIDAENPEARFLLGQLYLSQGNGLAAVKELGRANTLNYDTNKVVPLLARAYLLTENYEDILNLLEDSEDLVLLSKIKYLSYKSIAALLSDKIELAKETAFELKALSEANSYTLLVQAYIDFAENNAEEALLNVTKSISADVNNIDALLLKGHIAFALNNFSQAVENYQLYADLQPQIGVTKLLIANALLRDGSYDEAEKYADEILSILSTQPIANYVKAVALFERKDYTLAKEYAETALNQNYNLPVLKLIAGTSAFYLNNFESAHLHLSAVAKQLPPNHYARKILAISQLQLGLIEDINDTLVGFNATTSEGVDFLSNMSYQLAELGAVEDAKLISKQTNGDVELSAQQSVRQGVLKLMMNDPSGVEDLELALEENPDIEGVELAIAYAALQEGDFNKALNVAQGWQEKQPDLAGSYNMLAAVYIAQQKDDLAKKALQTSLTKDENNLFALTELAKLNFSEGNTAEAQRFASRAVDKFPDNPRALRYLYSVKPESDALDKIKQAYLKNSSNVALNLLYIDALIASEDLIKALDISNALEKNVKTPKKAWLQRLSIYQKQQNELQLVTTLEKWLQVNPYHIEPVLMLSEYYVKKRQADKALQYLDKALSGQHKENLAVKIVKIQLLLNLGKLDDAKNLYQDSQFEKINPALKSGLEGRIAFLEKDFVVAIKKLVPFYEAYPSSQNVMLLALAQKQAQKGDEAIQTLKIFLNANDSDTKVRALLASLYLEKQPEKSIPLYERMLIDSPENVVFLNNLAWLNLENNNIDLALKYSSEAIKLAPKHPSVLDTRGMILLKSGDKDIALKALTSAFELSKGTDVNIVLNYAEVLIANNKKDEARHILRRLKPEDPKQNARLKLLKVSAK